MKNTPQAGEEDPAPAVGMGQCLLESNFAGILWYDRESTFSELLQESFLRKMKNYCCSPIIQFIKLLQESFLRKMKNYCCSPIIQFIKLLQESFLRKMKNYCCSPIIQFIKLLQESFLRKMKNYCCSPIIQFINRNQEPNNTEKESKLCHHLLDFYRRNFLGDEERSINSMYSKTTTNPGSVRGDDERSINSTHSKTTTNPGSVRDVKDQVMASFRNVKELMATGIRIKRSPTRYLRDISFTSNGITACLRLPPITIDSSTKTLFLNLIAYEMSSNVPHDFISYLRFLDSLVDHADDVKELQYAGVLQNYLGTHEQVADFFNTVSSNLESNFHAYKDVRVKIRKHLKGTITAD